jgi:transposase
MRRTVSKQAVSKGQKIFVGIDVHKKHLSVSCLCEGEVIERVTMLNDAATLSRFLKRRFAGAEIHSVYEAGFSGFGLHRHLCGVGIHNLVVHAAAVEISARDRVKTDKRDALKLAVQLAAGRLQGIRIPSEGEERRRLVSRTRAQLVQERSRLKNQIRSKFHQFGYIAPTDERELSLPMVRALLTQGTPAELELVVKALVAVWESINLQLKHLLAEVKQQAERDPYEPTYRSVGGFGALTARELSNELGDMKQFRNERRLFSFTGLTPQEFSSGEHQRQGHISRQGRSRLRALLVEAAWRALRKDKALATFFAQLSVRVGKKRAIVAVARKLIGRVRAALRKGELYQCGYGCAA